MIDRYLTFISKYCPYSLIFVVPSAYHIKTRLDLLRHLHQSTQFLVSSYDLMCCSDRPYAIDQIKWQPDEVMLTECFQDGCGRCRQLNNFFVWSSTGRVFLWVLSAQFCYTHMSFSHEYSIGLSMLLFIHFQRF